MQLRCVIVDDNEAFLEVAAASLSGDGLVILGTATTSADAVVQVSEQNPDVVLIDVNLGRESGFDLARRLVEQFPHLAAGVVLISSRAEDDFGSLIEASPAIGFVTKKDLSATAVRNLVASRSPSDLEEK
jgi:CheY-like chemotaxis protein